MAAAKVSGEKSMTDIQVENTTYNDVQNDKAMAVELVEGEIWPGINKQTMLAFFVCLPEREQK
jgi:hypothetical protein